MNTTIETTTATAKTTTRRTTAKRPASSPVQPELIDQAVDLVVKRPASELTRLVFMALLGGAACIALVGVVSEANATGTSPDDPAPAVIVELAD